MPAVTQRIPNYLGGVSKQSDDKMLPGQVRECYNGFPDATYGLTKRPGFKHIANLVDNTPEAKCKWFYINRDDDEIYVGRIYGGNFGFNYPGVAANIEVWNALTGVKATITYESGTVPYLSGNREHFKLVTVQDTTIVINTSKVVAAKTAITTTTKTDGTVVLNTASPSNEYIVTIQGVDAVMTSDANDFTFDDILTDKNNHNLKQAIEALITAQQSANNADFTGTWTVTRNGTSSLDIKRVVNGVDTAFSLAARGALTNQGLTAFQDEVASVGSLPLESKHGRIVKILNTATAIDDYYAKFVADNGVSGRGYWEECLAPGVSSGLDNTTMPHELVNTGLNTFTFKKISYTDRLVGDDTTNEQPSFVGEKITNGFFHSNRLGFLSKDNVCMSQSGEYFNFYFKSAQTVLDSDPVDVSCSSIRPTALHSVLPTAQGVVLFSAKQQFMLFSDSGVLTPSLATIRSISNYEMDSGIDPVDVGTNINFISKTPGYTRVFSMVTRGQQEPPQVLDLSRVVKEWISPDIDQIVASPQNSMIVLSNQSSKEIYIFRYYNDGKENLMESWVNWTMPGLTQFSIIDQDDMYAVTRQGTQLVLSKAALSQSPEQAILVNSDGIKVNPCMDLYAVASSVVYDSTNELSKCYLPYNDIASLSPVLLIKGGQSDSLYLDGAPPPQSLNDLVESGFTITPDRGSDSNGAYFIVPNENLTSIASSVIVGFKYNFDVRLPKTYYRPDPKEADYTASLTLARMKFSVGLSGEMSFKVKQKGRLPYKVSLTGDGSTTVFSFNKNELDYVEKTDIKVSIDGIRTVDFSVTGDTEITFNTAPASGAVIHFYIDEWFAVNPVITTNTYIANDIPLDNQNVFTVALHQRTENVDIRMFNNSPFPVAVNAMMWEGNYTPRFYRRK
jgi:hypothetical protein